MRIGHSSSISMTVLCDAILAENLDLHIVDCAGYHDTRGFEINIGNNVNLKAHISHANSVKVVLLLNYKALEVSRGKDVEDMLEMCYQIFQSKEQFLKHKESILVSVTRVPNDVTFKKAEEIFSWHCS